MRSLLLGAAAVAAATLTGCVSYPVYQPVPVARLSPEQSAALASRPLSQSERDSYAAANAQVQREDQADLDAQRQAAITPYMYAYPVAPVYGYGYGGYYGYPGAYYVGFYPWYPGLSLSLGFRGGFGGGHRGGFHGGGHRGGFRGHR